MLKVTHIAFAAALIATPVTAAEDDVADGIDLLSEGTQLLLRGLMGEIEPTLREFSETGPMLRDLLGEFGPAMDELKGVIGDLNRYHAPEILPNGDIIIRRKTPAELAQPLKPGEDIEI